MKGFGLTLELARLAPGSEKGIWGYVFRPNEKNVDKLCSRRLFLDTRELDIFENGEGKDLCSSLAKIEPGEGLQFMRMFAESQSVLDCVRQLLGFPRRASWETIRNVCKVANQSEIVYRFMPGEQWLRTVSELDEHRREFLVFHSNIVPRQAYLRVAPACGTCTRQGCTEGFFRIDETDPWSRRCRGKCDLAEQLQPPSARPKKARSTNKLPPLVETDVKLVKDLGEGSDGSVSKILYRRGLFARKKFPRTGGQSSSSFVKERDVAKEVSHPNIVHFFSSSEIWSFDPAYSCLIMELLQEELDACLLQATRTGHQLSFPDSLLVLLQIAEAMTHLHDRGFVHGDLKPENIFVSRFTLPHSHVNDQFYLVKVADFGRTQRVDTPSAVQAFRFDIGSRHHKAPEVFKYCTQQSSKEELQPAPNEVSLKKIDVYSFGVVAFQVLTGLPSTDLGKGKREETKPSILLLVSSIFSFIVSFIFSFLHRFGHGSAPTKLSSEADGDYPAPPQHSRASVMKPDGDSSAPRRFSIPSVMKPDGDKTQWRPSCDFVGNLKGGRSKLLSLIKECWSSSPDIRPDFPTIRERIQALYDECFPSKENSVVKVWTLLGNKAIEPLNPTSALRSKKDS